ncbi:peptide ABC transporter substrate-binding protein [Candidatus Similichlamydia epinepheli]|uniref:peptide ABC transporter substrate-binding protein n=1 Tax=Candidatus Similichlamydia epinepheli TaxID=1903953 RepID=UPI0013002DFC|nr:peptide ABC transporter substrate-binding protein [Candidatus Similichlamydia epinepheli]
MRRIHFLFLSVCASLFVSSFFFLKRHKSNASNMERTWLRLNLGAPPQEINPHFVRDTNSGFVVLHLYEGLFRLGEKGSLLPALAKRTSISKNGLDYEIELRPSYWSDGSPLTAHDFIRSWHSVLSPRERFSPFRSSLGILQGSEQIDPFRPDWSKLSLFAKNDHTLCFSLRKRMPTFLFLLTQPIFFPVHPHGQKDASITNGPFRVVKGNQQHITWEKNPFFWDAKSVQMEKVDLFFFQDEAVQTSLFLRNKIDWIGGCLLPIAESSLGQLQESDGESSSVHYIILNTASKIFSSQKIRRAFSMSLNRLELSGKISKRFFPAYRYLPPVFSSQIEMNSLFENLEDALESLEKGLLEQKLIAEHLNSIRFICHPGQVALVKLLQETWEKIFGFRINIQLVDSQTFLSRLERGDFDCAIQGMSASYPDPYTLLEPFRDKKGSNNFSNWSSFFFLHFLEEGLSAEGQNRLPFLRKLERTLLAEMPIIPLFFEKQIYAYQKGLSGVIVQEWRMVDFSRAYWTS